MNLSKPEINKIAQTIHDYLTVYTSCLDDLSEEQSTKVGSGIKEYLTRMNHEDNKVLESISHRFREAYIKLQTPYIGYCGDDPNPFFFQSDGYGIIFDAPTLSELLKKIDTYLSGLKIEGKIK